MQKITVIGAIGILVMVFFQARTPTGNAPAAIPSQSREAFDHPAAHMSPSGNASQAVEGSSAAAPAGLDKGAKWQRLNDIKTRMSGKNHDTKRILHELSKRLKESPDGKLSREEVLRILPKDMARDFDEFMAVIQSEHGGGRL